MRGLMQDWPLTVDHILDHAANVHGGREIVSRRTDGILHRTDYATLRDRARRVSNALRGFDIGLGDRVATLAWNSERHMECWYGAMGIGAVLHTINPRMHPDQIAWIANHAQDRVLILDTTFVPMIEVIRDRLPIRDYVIIADRAAMPPNRLDAHCFEDWIADRDVVADWGRFDENTACGLCYTSGTTGNPKGVLYSHRSNVLHAMMVMGKGALGIGPDDVVMPVVPMFHANAWGLAFACPAAGAKMVMPGAQLDGASLFELIDGEGVTFASAVPTVWLGLLEHLRAHKLALPRLQRIVVGGAALPAVILTAYEKEFGVEVVHGWGMTETSPLGSVGGVPAALQDADAPTRVAQKLKQGRPPFGVEMKLVDEHGAALPHDGQTPGHLLVRGFAVAAEYFQQPGESILDEDGFFDTGDIATIDSFGMMRITDRAKDVIKSGGEWISSIEIENLVLSHPAVANAAVIGMPHPKWDERPLLVIEPRSGASVSDREIRAYLEGKIAKWWMPDEIHFVDAIPLGTTGKVNKIALRERHAAI